MLLDIFFMTPNIRLYYYVFVFTLIVVILLKHFEKIKDEYKNIPKKTWYAIIIISAIGFIIRLLLAPMQTIDGVTVWSHRLHTVIISREHLINPSTHTRGYSLLVSPLYSLTKDIVWSSHMFDIIMGALSIIMVFLLTYILFRDRRAAIISAIIITLLPWHIFFSGTHGIEITSSFFIMLSLILIIISIKSKEPQLYFLAFISILFNGLIKKEEIIIILILVTYFLYKKRPVKLSNPPKCLLYIFTAIVLTIPYIIDVVTKNFNEGQLGTDYYINNILSISDIFMYNFPIVLLITAPIVLYITNKKTIKKNKESIYLLLIWFSVALIPFLLVHTVKTRYFIYFLLPLVPLISFSISRLLETKYRKKVYLALVLILIISAFHIKTECPQINEDCRYLVAEPMRWADTKLPEIYDRLNITTNEDSYIVFMGSQQKKAFKALYPDYPHNLKRALNLKNDPKERHILRAYNHSVNQDIYPGYDIFVIDFEDFTGYSEAEDIVAFYEILNDYDKELYYAGDRYKIYKLI